MTDDFKKSNCSTCINCYLIYKGMYGCNYPPYKGKWIAEIESCPKIKDKVAEGI